MKPDDAPPMRGEDVPTEVVRAAERGYSMHGAGLVANILAAAWPAIDQQIRAEVAAEMQRAAAGRRAYANQAPDHLAEVLRTEAAAFETASRLATDPTVQLDLLPVHMWTEEEASIARGEMPQ